MSPTTHRMKQNHSAASMPAKSPSANGSPTNRSPPKSSMKSTISSSNPPAILPSHPPPTYLLIYPLILILATAFSLVSPIANPPLATTSTAGGTAHIPNAPPTANYFSSKRNILNLYFVKILWFWVTFAFSLLLYFSPAYLAASPLDITRQRLLRTARGLARYALVTLTWVLVTQWCFGPALIDRSFTVTGGACEIPTDRTPGTILTSQTCKVKGGSWKGGHDISGHVFLLVLASAFLALELLGMRGVEASFNSRNTSSKMTVSFERRGSSSASDSLPSVSANSSSPLDSAAEAARSNPWHVYTAWTIVGLSFWMLLMTGIWFHTFLEKLSGLGISLAAVYGVYFLPRSIPAWKEIIGLPGQ